MGITAIFGGTFNPLHIGHYEIISALQNMNEIDKILILPDRIPPHKLCDFLVEDDTRIEMCRIAANDFPKAEVCLLEFERKGKSYTYDTVIQLKNKYPDTNFAFVLGGDMLVFFDKWYNYKELMKLLPFIVFKRTDTDEIYFKECINNLKNMGMSITVMKERITTVSSTIIRNGFQNSKELLPPKIYEFLKEKGEYLV